MEGVILASLVAAIGASTGLFLRRTHQGLLPLAAGAMLALALLLLIPEAYTLIPGQAMWGIVLGFVLLYGIESITMVHPCVEVEEHCHEHHLSPLARGIVIGHGLLDGIVIGLSIQVDIRFGVLAAIGVAVHHIPVSLALRSLSAHKGGTRWWWVIFILIVPVGIVLGYRGIGLSDGLVGRALALMGGGLLYLSASDILPSSHAVFPVRRHAFLWFVLGMSAMVVASIIHQG